jgi:hypothetical protein
MAKRKTSSKLKANTSRKAWELLKAGDNYVSIGEAVGYTSTAIKIFAARKFKEKADELWSKQIRAVGKCEVCGIDYGLNAHHILERSVWYHLRFDLSNGICLCQDHHTLNPVISAHKCMPSTEEFLRWLEENRNGQFVFYQERKLDQKYQAIDFEPEYRRLLEIGEL